MFFFGVFILLKNIRKRINWIFFAFSLSISVWLSASFAAHISHEFVNKLFWFKMSYLGIIFISSTFFHFISDLVKAEHDDFKRGGRAGQGFDEQTMPVDLR
ncbi:MAG: histidine kinase N-terminal 7TM domain-containing protein [Candidatus Omnitrophota bacterium]